MGLLSFLLGGRASDEGELTEEEKHPDLQHQPGRDFASDLHRMEEERATEAEGRAPHLAGVESASRRLAGRLRRDQVPKWSGVSSKLARLEERLGAAQSEEELREVARRARGRQGIFQKIERGMEKRLDSHLDELRSQGASEGKLRSARRQWGRRYGKDLRKLERRLERPTTYLR